MNAPSVAFQQRLTVRLTAGVTLVLLGIGVPFLLAFHRLRRAEQLEALTELSAGMSRIVADGLRSAMMAGEPHLLDEAIQDLASHSDVERVLLLDRVGAVRLSSDPSFHDHVFDRDRDPTCQICHQGPGILPSRGTVVVEEAGRPLLRAMSTIPNETRCHECHDPTQTTNGILLMDLPLRAAAQSFFAGITSTVILGIVMVVVTIAVLVKLLRRMVHDPLADVVTTSREIVGGDLEARVPITSTGEFALLARDVNRMTDHLARSIQAEEAHRLELQAILDSVDDEIVVLDVDRRVLDSNQAFRAGLRHPENITGRPCREVSALRPCSEDPARCPVEEVLATGLLQKGLMSRVNETGTERFFEIHASPVRGPGGSVERVVEVRRDISERRQMEATLADSERLSSLGLLAAGISHEVNNPLGSIAATVDGLRRRAAQRQEDSRGSPEELVPTLTRIASEVQRARTITDRLLKVSRSPGHSRVLVDVNAALTDTLALLAYQIDQQRIKTNTDFSEKLPPIVADESQFSQILMNLVMNAIQAMSDGGTLTLSTASQNGSVEIRVEDTGVGIPPENLHRIYEPFFTTKPSGKGTGLGLFITHRMVSAMSGTIDVRSKKGMGTRFTVSLPIESRKRAST
jgi:PAS domain S-box-containing protein